MKGQYLSSAIDTNRPKGPPPLQAPSTNSKQSEPPLMGENDHMEAEDEDEDFDFDEIQRSYQDNYGV